jgi:2-polyprenyl-3-methyl-5-hydroxy-6-metoxy-1,4-benzoquinol methylase
MTKAKRKSDVDSVQSSQYSFPYHYIPSAKGFPNFSKRWEYSSSYIAAIKLFDEWLSELPKRENHKHIDYGCGDGGFVNALAKFDEHQNVSFSGIDYDKNAIRWAKLFAINPDNFTAGDISDLPSNYYDSGSLIEVFEHIPPSECNEFVKAIASSLKEGGLLFLTVPSNEKPVSEKHYRHFDFKLLADSFEGSFIVKDLFGFEKKNFKSRLLQKVTFHRLWHFESRLSNKILISQFAAKHRHLSGCGRIGMIVQRR